MLARSKALKSLGGGKNISLDEIKALTPSSHIIILL